MQAGQQRPTPGANDHKGSHKLGQRRGQLDEATEQRWTTPQAHDVTERGSGQVPSSKAGNACLARDARTFTPPARPTPRLGDGSLNGGRGSRRPSIRAPLMSWLEQGDSTDFSRLDAIVASAAGLHARRLNPLFVEWLQGLPIGWTSLEPIDSGRLATWRRLLSRLLPSTNCGSGSMDRGTA